MSRQYNYNGYNNGQSLHDEAFIQQNYHNHRSARTRGRKLNNKRENYSNTLNKSQSLQQLEPKFDTIGLSLKMETVFLETTHKPLPRLSSPTRDICFHCDHDHNQTCCLYYNDGPEDGPMYSNWKKELEQPDRMRPYNVTKIPEAVSGGTTPKGFPSFSYNNPDIIEKQIGINKHTGVPAMWFRHYYYPLFASNAIPTIHSIEAPSREDKKHDQSQQQNSPLCCNLHYQLSLQMQHEAALTTRVRQNHIIPKPQPNYRNMPPQRQFFAPHPSPFLPRPVYFPQSAPIYKFSTYQPISFGNFNNQTPIFAYNV